ncbi:MAG TPA: hypothetical protein VFZ56_12150 [Gemmatimonadaceae bacterium]
MLRKTITTGIALAAVIAVSACGGDDETAAMDTVGAWETTPADTATLGVPGGTLGAPDTLGVGTDTTRDTTTP